MDQNSVHPRKFVFVCMTYSPTPFGLPTHDPDRWPTFLSCCGHSRLSAFRLSGWPSVSTHSVKPKNVSALTAGRPAVRKGGNGQSAFEQLHLSLLQPCPIPLPYISCSSCTATVLSSNAWDRILLNWNEAFHRPPSHEINHSLCITVF